MMRTTYISIFLLFSIIISSLCVLEGLDYQQWPEAFRNFSNTKCLGTPNNFTLPDNDIGNSSNCVGAPFHNITDQNWIPTLDHLKLVQQWPKAFCFLNSGCQRNPNNFTLHGLWPEKKSGNSNYCAGAASFRGIRDQNLISRLESSWPDLFEPDCKRTRCQSFWGRQWEKHGTCSNTPYDYEAYFNLAVDLKNMHDILGTLGQSGIRPGHYVRVRRVYSSIAEATGSRIQIRCLEKYFDNYQVLYEIIICYNLEGTIVIDCPLPKYDRCWHKGYTYVVFLLN